MALWFFLLNLSLLKKTRLKISLALLCYAYPQFNEIQCDILYFFRWIMFASLRMQNINAPMPNEFVAFGIFFFVVEKFANYLLLDGFSNKNKEKKQTNKN